MNNNLELALKIKVLIDGIKGVETLVGQLRTLTQASNAGTNDATAQLRDGLDQTTVAIKGVAAELGKLLNGKKQGADPTAAVREGVEHTAEAVREVGADLDALGQADKQVEDPTVSARAGIEQTAEAVREVGAELDALGQEDKQVEDPTTAARAGIEQTAKALHDTATNLTATLRQQAATLGFNAEQTLRYRLTSGDLVGVEKGLANQLLASARALDEKRASLQPAEKESGALAAATKGLGAALSALGVTLTAVRLADFIKDAVLLASRLDTLSVVLGVVGRNALISQGEMEGHVEAVKALGITTQVAADVVVRMTQAQLDLAKSTALARVAQDAAVVGNVNSSEALQRILNGIVTLQPEVLRTIGIVIDLESEYTKFASAANRAVDTLTSQEKQQIALNATLREGAKLSGAYEGAMGTANKQLNSMARLIESLQEQMGRPFQPAFAASVSTLSTLIEQATENLRSWNLLLGTSGLETASLEKVDATIESISKDIARLAVESDKKNFLERLFGGTRISALKSQLEELVAIRQKLLTDPAAIGRRLSSFGQIGITRAEDFGPTEEQLAAQAKRAAKLRSDQLALVKASVEAQAKLIADGIAREEQLLDRQKADNLISLRDYYARRAALEQQAADAEINRAKAEIAAQRKVLADLAKPQPGIKPEDQEQDRLQALAKVKTLEAELIILERKRGDIAGQAAREQAQAEKDLAAELDRVHLALLQAQGRAGDARVLELGQQYGELIKRMQVEGDAAGEELVRKLINVEAARAQLDQLRAEYDRVLSQMQVDEQRISNDRDAGLKTELQARKEIIDLHRRTSEQLSKLLPQMQALGESIGPDAANEVARIAEEVRGLGLVVNDVAARVNGSLQTGLTQFFDDLAAGTKKGSTLFEEFGNSVIATIRRIAAEQAATKLLGAFNASSIGQFIGSFLGGGTPAPVHHTGGVVGAVAASRTVSPLAFVSAPRYHSGGVLGLKPDEVPAILQRGEEVLTRNDPRHRDNGGMGGSNVSVQMTINTPDADSFRRSQGRIARDMAEAARRAQERHS